MSAEASLSREILRWIVVIAFLSLWAAPARAEQSSKSAYADAWTFLEAWQTFRYDLDATLPGEHGEVPLITRLINEPPWVLRDGLRLATSPETLIVLARRIARRGDIKGIPALRRALSTTKSDPGQRALERALVRLGDTAMLMILSKRLRKAPPQERREDADTLIAAGSKATPLLSAALGDPDIQTRLAAAAALAGQKHRPAQKLLHKLLKSPNPFYRTEAAHALARAGDKRSIPVLREKLEHQGADWMRVVRSLGFVGAEVEHNLLVGTWASVPRGRSQALRRELLIALGRIALRGPLSKLFPQLSRLDEADDDDTGIRGAWLEAIGWAAIKGARDHRAFPAKIKASLERSFVRETPVAHTMRKQRVKALLSVMSGGQLPAQTPLKITASTDKLVQWIRVRNPDDAKTRNRRFDAALRLLDIFGERLGHPGLADPPDLQPVGLGGERALDGNFLTAWIAGSMARSLRLDLPGPTKLKGLLIVNGCVDSRRSYQEHARVKELVIVLDGGRTVTGAFTDGNPYFQRVKLPNVTLNQLMVKVSKTFPGKRAKAPACIAEIRVE